MRAAGIAIAIGLMTGMAAPALAQAPAAAATEKWVPVFEEPRHHLVVDTPTLRILDIQIPPGDTTLFHMHNSAMIYVPISSSRTRSQTLGEDWPAPGPAAAATPAPAAPARPGRINGGANYVERPTTHRVNNIGTTLFRLIGIANMTPGDATAPAASAAKPEMENRWYRVERLVIAPGASAPVPSYAGAVVVVMQTPGTAAVDGAVWQPLNGPGDFARIDGSKPYVVHNRGAAEIEVVAVAVKGAK